MEDGYNGWSCHQAWELALMLDNDERANKNLWEFAKIYYKRMDKGTYNRTLALKGLIETYIPQNLTRIRKNGLLMYKTYPYIIKKEVAITLLEMIEQEYKYRGNKK